MRLWINAAKPEMPVLMRTDNFRSLFSGRGLLQTVAEDWARLEKRIRKHMARMATDALRTGREGGASIRLVSSQWQKWRIEMRAACRFEIFPPQQDGAIPVAITFERVTQPVFLRINQETQLPAYDTLLAKSPERRVEQL